jgi:hypothetical protein
MSAELRREKIVDSATQQFRNLLESRYLQILKAASDSFADDDNAVEPTCKVGVTVEWDAIAPSTKVAVKISWSAKFRDESDDIVDVEQLNIDLQPGGEAEPNGGA